MIQRLIFALYLSSNIILTPMTQSIQVHAHAEKAFSTMLLKVNVLITTEADE
jgi:hypothetical protein